MELHGSRRPSLVALIAGAAVAVLAGPLTEPAGAVAITGYPLPVPNSSPLGIAAGPDGNVWFTEVSGSRIGRITPSGTITDWSTGSGISANSRPWDITAGPDGNMWFTEESGNRIGKITMAAVATELTNALLTNAGPRGITSGGGFVWYAEDTGNVIGRMAADGGTAEYPLGLGPGARPLDVAFGPDGNVWATTQAGSIVRITGAGAPAPFSVGITPNSRPSDITAGPDGNLWFTEIGASRVARITPAGTVTEFAAGITPASQPRGITTGPDGNLWFAEEAGRIGRITPAGAVTEFPFAGSRPAGIATGPTGHLWFTDPSGNRIGRVSIEPDVTTGAPSVVSADAAAVKGTVRGYASPTTTTVQYGRTTAYGNSTTPDALGGTGPTGPRAITATLDGLAPGTLYHYRVTATTTGATTRGADRTFRTPASAEAPGGARTVADRGAPVMRLLTRTMRLSRRGRVSLRLSCPAAERRGCRVRVTLRTRSRRPVTLGSKAARVAGGTSRTISIALSRRGRALARRGRLGVRITIAARDADGNRRTSTATRTLSLAG